jgi:hypothetical protein
MRAHALAFVISLALVAAGCATNRASPDAQDAEATALMKQEDANLQTYRIENWSAPDSRSLIVESTDGTRYRAQFMTDCIGLTFASSIGFDTRGLNRLDRYAGIVLPDGTRCPFESFTKIGFAEKKSAEADSETEQR